jgi:tetratricopeptide (TPR) repeat protein
MPVLKTVRYAWGMIVVVVLACAASAQSSETVRLLAAQRLYAQGQYTDARAMLTALLQESKNGAPDRRFRASLLDNLGLVNEGTGNYAEAERRFNDGLSTLRDEPAGNSVDLKTHLAELYVREHRPQEAESLLRQAIDGAKSLSHTDPAALSEAYNDLAVACLMQREFRDAETFSRHAQTIIETQLDAYGPALAGSLLTYAQLLSDEHHFAAAIAPAEHALQILRASKPPIGKSYFAGALTAAGAIYFRAGHDAEAASCVREAIELAEQVLGSEHRRLGLYLANYAAILKHSGHKKEAQSIQKRSEEIMERYPAADDSGGYTVDVAALR